MRKPKEILNAWGIRSTPRTEEAVREAQKEAWNEAIEAVAGHATEIVYDSVNYDSLEVIRRELILKLKK